MLTLRASAKLNLYLRVLGRRSDGYHELETLFERIDLADEVTFELADTLSLSCDDPALSCGEDNLVLKAARLLQQTSAAAHGARIHLRKRIPVAAGLGGGSSDAAAALTGLNQMWGLGLDAVRLLALGAQLGSDVPFFLHEAAFAIGRGRGEQCTAVPDAPRLAHVLVTPPERLSTKEIYAGFDAEGFDLTASKPSISIAVHALRNGSLGELATGLWNDLEPEAIRRCPPISFILLELRSLGCLGTRLSGSGPSVFGLCRDTHHASAIAARVRASVAPSWRVDIIQTDSPSLVSP